MKKSSLTNIIFVLIFLLGFGWLITSIVSDSAREKELSEPQTEPATEDMKWGIEPASFQQLDLIKEVQIPGNYIKMKGCAIKSRNHKRAYYVSTKIYGPGIEDGVTGVWFITGDKDTPGIIQNVDGVSRQFTPDLPYGADTSSGASMFDTGVSPLRRWTERNL